MFQFLYRLQTIFDKFIYFRFRERRNKASTSRPKAKQIMENPETSIPQNMEKMKNATAVPKKTPRCAK